MLNDTLTLVQVINTYDALLIDDIVRRFHLAEASYAKASRRLKSLSDPDDKDRLLDAKWIPHPTKLRGGPSKVYLVGPGGEKLLRAQGQEVKRFDFGHTNEVSKHNWHSLYVNKALISAYLWADQVPGVNIAAKQTDFDFKREANKHPARYKVKWGDGTTHGIVPDGLLAFEFEEKDEEDKQFLLELETGSQEPAAIREKVHSLVMFEQKFPEVFNSTLFNGYLFFAMGIYGKRYLSPDDHRKVLLREIAKQLGEMDLREEYGPLFRVTAEPPDSPHLFDRAVWWFPGQYEPFRLFVDLT